MVVGEDVVWGGKKLELCLFMAVREEYDKEHCSTSIQPNSQSSKYIIPGVFKYLPLHKH